MDTPLWDRSSTRTRRAFIKTRRAFGYPYQYFPRWNLIERWARELNWSTDQVVEQFYKERKYLVKLYKGITIAG